MGGGGTSRETRLVRKEKVGFLFLFERGRGRGRGRGRARGSYMFLVTLPHRAVSGASYEPGHKARQMMLERATCSRVRGMVGKHGWLRWVG